MTQAPRLPPRAASRGIGVDDSRVLHFRNLYCFSHIPHAHFFSQISLFIFPTMAHAGLSSAQLLPRFLLPRLSWQSLQAGPANIQTIRALSTVSSYHTTSIKPIESPSKRYTVLSKQHAAPRSKTTISQNPVHRRAFHATPRRGRDHHFDTLKFVQRLQEEGFTEAQSVAMMKVLSDVIQERLEVS